MKYTLTIDIGERTCYKADLSSAPSMCPFVRASHYGTRFHCGLFVSSRELVDEDGWLLRSDECLKTLKKADE